MNRKQTREMRLVFADTFSHAQDGSYPDGWVCETACELPFKQGTVHAGRFHLSPNGAASKHLAPVPALISFKLRFKVYEDQFFPGKDLGVFFHFNRESRQGLLLRHHWVRGGRKPRHLQNASMRHRCQLYRCCDQSCQLLAEKEFELCGSGKFELQVTAQGQVRFKQGGVEVANFVLPADGTTPTAGSVAFSRFDERGDLALGEMKIYSAETLEETVVRRETRTVFPAAVHRIISPYYFHVGVVTRGGALFLSAKLTGGPEKEASYPELNRQRFGEKMTNPYVRLEDGKGRDLGKFLICKGTVGLDALHWNVDCSALAPADASCPLEREIMLEVFPSDTLLFIGYEHYFAEDSICRAGGPAEALIGGNGEVVWFGGKFARNDVLAAIKSPPDKKICGRIPGDIPFYDEALAFAQNNHFFLQHEAIRFQLLLDSRDAELERAELGGEVVIEDVFGEKLGEAFTVGFEEEGGIAGIPGAKRFASAFFVVTPLPVGVYHINVCFTGLGLPQRVRSAFEVMPDNPTAQSAPLAAGLPELYPNILSGISSEHFHPWGAAVVDTAHYNSGGNNYFKVARDWRAPELLHVYGRRFICWLKPWKTVFKERGFEPNADLIRQSYATHITMSRYRDGDLWGHKRYRDSRKFHFLLDFLRSVSCKAFPGALLTYEALTGRDPGEGLHPEEYEELVNQHWKAWTLYVCARHRDELQNDFDTLKALNPSCAPFAMGATLPAYTSGYKMGYFPLSFGRDLRSGLSRFLPGPNGFEDYPYSSGYPTARGICHLMASKLEDPGLKLYPEVFGLNGETLDSRVVHAHPPFGRSNPPAGFLTTQFHEYCFATVWFDGKGFNYWADHGYYPKTWSRANYEEMLAVYAFISRTKPLRPLRAPAYAYSRAACLAHDDYHETGGGINSTVVNSAEEAPAYAYEQARGAGIQAGFVLKLEDCGKLNAADVDFLVLPPLCGVDVATQAAIRELHGRGVGLLGFEDVGGLEDLFGVEKSQETKVSRIVPSGAFLETGLAELSEKTRHPLCVVRHKLKGAEALLQDVDGAPVLALHTTKHGKTALFTLPPTFVKRSRIDHALGQRSNSELINTATAQVQRLLSRPLVTTSAGSLIAFEDMRGHVHVLVSENSCPRPGVEIRAALTLRLPGIKPEDIVSDKDFEVVGSSVDALRLRFVLRPYESARLELTRELPHGQKTPLEPHITHKGDLNA